MRLLASAGLAIPFEKTDYKGALEGYFTILRYEEQILLSSTTKEKQAHLARCSPRGSRAGGE
jgi:hypothetical protein